LKRTETTFFFLGFVLLNMLAAGCTSIGSIPEGIFVGDAFSEMHAELRTVAEVERVEEKEFIVRFPQVTLFHINEYSLRAEAELILGKVTVALRKYPGFTVIVEGHTDTTGSEAYNQWLSERRSRIVADFLVRKGLDPNRIQVVGYGECRPLVTNETPEGRQRNRRVEIHIQPRQQ
jgi:outer membrane protein OmpA-like peptidoglycan-associated protein